jgi:hypothetical protein
MSCFLDIRSKAMGVVVEQEVSDRNRIAMWVGWFAGCGALVLGLIVGMKAIKAHHGGLAMAMGVTAVVLLGIVALNYWCVRWTRRVCAEASEAARRFRRRQFTATAAYALLFFIALWMRFGLRLAGPAALAVSILPALPLVALVAVMGLYLREETDEFERMVLAESALWGAGIMLAASTVWGFMETLAQAPHAFGWVWFPVWSAAMGLSQVVIRRRFR